MKRKKYVEKGEYVEKKNKMKKISTRLELVKPKCSAELEKLYSSYIVLETHVIISRSYRITIAITKNLITHS